MSSSDRKACVARTACSQMSTRTSRSVGIARRILMAPCAFRASELVISLTSLSAYHGPVSIFSQVSITRRQSAFRRRWPSLRLPAVPFFLAAIASQAESGATWSPTPCQTEVMFRDQQGSERDQCCVPCSTAQREQGTERQSRVERRGHRYFGRVHTTASIDYRDRK
jgi:hypothetical protein